MNRVMLLFLILLVIATLTLGLTWRGLEGLINRQSTTVNLVQVSLSAPLFALALLVLARILYRTATIVKVVESTTEKEESHD